MPLKYLFIATFADGHKIVQTPDDKSSIEPEKRSQFFDVLQYAEKSPLIRFELMQDHTYAVDLRDGHFEVDGVPFRMHEDPELSGFRLIFFRQHTHSFNVSSAKNEEISHAIVYRMGWQAKGVDGKNYQHVMQID